MNLAAVIEQHALARGTKPAIVSGQRVTTYHDLQLAARRYAEGLRLCGVKPGDLVGLFMKDSPEHIIASLAVMRLGAVAIPMDWRWKAGELQRAVEEFTPTVILSDLDTSRFGIPSIHHISEFDHLPPQDAPVVELEDGPLAYALSSGTTGKPKAMVLKHSNMHARLAHLSAEFPLLTEDRFLMALPLAYGAGRTFTFTMLCLGATLVQMPTLFEPGDLLRTVADQKVSALILPPNVTRSLLALENSAERMMPNLRLFVTGTSGLTPDEREQVRRRIANRTLSLYACTGSGPICLLHDDLDRVAPDSVGVPLRSAQITIADDEGREVPGGEIGRIRMRGSTVIDRILGAIPGADEGVRDGWYYPGDFGSMDKAGRLYLQGRTTDMIKRGGMAVSAPEVEGVLLSHDAVKEAAVIGVPAGDVGEEVVAFVVANKPLDPLDLVVHCRRVMAPFKIPKIIKIVDSLPRNPNGKVIKSELQKLL
jgi:long-chain acyl-CoA synthetase